MAKLDDLEFRISASTTELKNALANGSAAVQDFASKTESALSRHNTSLEHISRTASRVFNLYGAIRAVDWFKSWIEGAIKTNQLTTEQFASLQASEKALGEVKKATDQLAISIGSGLAPAIEKAALWWREFLFPTGQEAADTRVDRLNKQIETTIARINRLSDQNIGNLGVQKQIEAAVRALQEYKTELEGLRQTQPLLSTGDKTGAGQYKGLFATPKEEADLNNFIADMNNAVAARQQSEEEFLNNFIADMNNAVAARARTEEEFINNFIGEMNMAIAEREAKGQPLSPELATFIDDAKRADEVTKSVRTGVEQVRDTYAEAQALFAQGLISPETLARTKEGAKSMKNFADTFAATFQSRGIQALLDGDVGGAIKGLARDFTELMLRLLILQPIAERLVATIQGTSTTGGFFSGVVSAFAGMFGGGRADGGPVAAGVPYMVGERGPELFIPNTSGRISNNVGQNVQVIQNIHYDVSLESVDNRIAQSAGPISNLAAMAVRTALTRPRMA